MTREEYISAVLKEISSGRKRNMVKREIESHIDDRIEYYTDCGFDADTAASKAVEHMGDPKKAGEEFGRVYHEKGTVRFELFALAVSVLLVYFTFFTAFYNTNVWGEKIHITGETILLTLFCYEMYKSKKQGNFFTACLTFFQYIVFMLKKIVLERCHSYFLLGVYTLITLRPSEVFGLCNLETDFRIDSAVFTVLSAVFLLALGLFEVLVLKSVSEDITFRTKKRKINISAALKIMLRALSVLCTSFIIIVITCFALRNAESPLLVKDKINITERVIRVYQSDTAKTDIEEIRSASSNNLNNLHFVGTTCTVEFLGDETVTPVSESKTVGEIRKTDISFISYKCDVTRVTFPVFKKYITIIDEDGNIIEPYRAVSVSEIGIIRGMQRDEFLWFMQQYPDLYEISFEVAEE